MTKVIRYLSLVIIGAGILSTTPVLAQTVYYVNGDCGNNAWSGLTPDCIPSDGPKSTIGAAINVAVSGDTILVAPGTYLENLDYRGKDIVISSTDGPETTVIDGSGSVTSVVRFGNGESPAAVLNGFSIINGDERLGGGISCEDSSPTISNNIIRDNVGHFGGGVFTARGLATIVGNLIFDNIVVDCHDDHLCGSGAGIYVRNGSALIEDNVIQANLAELFGGALVVDVNLNSGVFDIVCRNNLIVENRADRFGGGIYQFYNGDLVVLGSTFSNNSAGESGDGFYIGGAGGATASFENSILYGNGIGDQEIAITGGEVTIGYSDIRNGLDGVLISGGNLVWNAGNISADPQFVDPLQSDYHLDDCSAAINVGNPAYVPEPAETDLDGEQRVLGIAIDMGVDEVPHVDVNGNGIPDGCECDPCDMNCDGDVSALDIEPFLELLFDAGVPCDICTGDVNADGSINALDIEPFLECLFG